MRVYVAASWRTPTQPEVVRALRSDGHEVYDFRESGFNWREISVAWKTWTTSDYAQALLHPLAVAGFNRDMTALRRADAVVLLQPSGRSAALEFGWACAAGKLTIACIDAMPEPDLMVKMAHLTADNLWQVRSFLREKV